ncbi:MAG: hypothetical protein ISS28_06990 [Candidatus Cloacimonetes bacterium]|nr:hypothetical protein [Candidatus Cloacimonadota bacterium]
MKGNCIMKIFEVILIENDEPIVGSLPSDGCVQPMEGCYLPPDMDDPDMVH